MSLPRSYDRYSIVAIAFHWTIALLIAWMFWIGWWMTDAINKPETQAAAFKAYQFHKSLGLTILVLSVLRLVWRLTHRPPPLPAHMPAWEKLAARLSHILLYVVMIGIPLSGWIYVSAGWNADINAPFAVPTIWFGQFEWPHIGWVASASDAVRAKVAGVSMDAHEWIGWAAIALVAIHVAAALKHHFYDRDAVLAGMLPGVRPRRPAITEEPAE